MVFERCVPAGPVSAVGGIYLPGSNAQGIAVAPKAGAPFVILTLAEALDERSVAPAIDTLVHAHRHPPLKDPANGLPVRIEHHSNVDHKASAATTANCADEELIVSQCARMAEVVEARVKAALSQHHADLLAEIERLLGKFGNVNLPATPMPSAWVPQMAMCKSNSADSPASPQLVPAFSCSMTQGLDPGPLSHNPSLFVVSHDSEDDGENDEATAEASINKERKTKRLMALAAREKQDYSGKSFLARLVHSPRFELVSMMLIVFNVFVMATEIHYIGLDVGFRMGYPGYDRDADSAMPHMERALKLVSLVFMLLFAFELGLRIAGRGTEHLYKPGWLWFDAAMVILALLHVLEDWGIWAPIKVNAAVARLLRLVRIARVLKVVSSLDSLQPLFLLVKSIQASLAACFWSLTMLIGLMCTFGMCLNQTVIGLMADERQPLPERQDLFRYFGTFSRLMVSMFEITVGNWIPPCRLLMEVVGESYGIAVVLYRCFLCFAVVSVINAVFITETHRVAASDDEVALMRRERQATEFMSKLEDLFTELDEDGDGKLSTKEFHTLMHDKLIRKFMGTLEIDTSDVQTLFSILDDGDGEVLKEEFMHGVQAIRGHAKGISTIEILNNVRRIEKKILKLDRKLGAGLMVPAPPPSQWRQSAGAKTIEAPAS